MCLAGCEHIVLGYFLLHDAPHAFNIIARMPPVPLCVEIAKTQLAHEAAFDGGNAARDFPRDECLPANGALMVEENAVGCVKAVTFPVIDRHPVCVEFCRSIGASRIERRTLVLSNGAHPPEQLRCGRLIKPATVAEVQNAHGFQ
ncbi:hypothetical protein D3C80_1795880 [compost metagenome]